MSFAIGDGRWETYDEAAFLRTSPSFQSGAEWPNLGIQGRYGCIGICHPMRSRLSLSTWAWISASKSLGGVGALEKTFIIN